MIHAKKLVEEYRKQIGHFTYAEMDCIRSIANILYRYGGRSELTGSNWFARHEIVNLRQLTSKKQLYDGCAVLKTVLPGEAGYDLNLRYKNSEILIDYNHIGLGTDEGQILDSTRSMKGDVYVRNGPGISTANIGPQSWDVMGDFEDVDYTDKGEVIIVAEQKAIVIAQTGNTVNLRARQTLDSSVKEYVKVGEEVIVLDQAGEWWNIRTAKGNDGWMKPEFLTLLPGSVIEPTTALTAEQIGELRAAIAHIQTVIGNG